MRDQRPGRLATVGEARRLHVEPGGFRHDPEPGVVDDELRSAPWRARGAEVRGRAEAVDGNGGSGGEIVRNFPGRIASWGIAPDAPGVKTRYVPG